MFVFNIQHKETGLNTLCHISQWGKIMMDISADLECVGIKGCHIV